MGGHAFGKFLKGNGMLSFISDYKNINRRGFLRLGSLAGLSLPKIISASPSGKALHGGKSVILYWMSGGPSQLETWDPKPDAPVEIRGAFKSIPTRTSGMRFGELLPNLAKISDKFTILRSVTHQENNHPDASHLVQTGYHEKNVQFRGQIYPAQGSLVSKILGKQNPGIPPYVCIPDAYFARQGFFQQSAYLGKEFNPVNSGGEPDFRHTSPCPSFATPNEITLPRVEGRRKLLQQFDQLRSLASPSLAQMDKSYQSAFEIITSQKTRDAFDISKEPILLREKYGNNPWGRGTLLARRLVESGVTFVTMNHYQADVDWWDDHTAIASNLGKRLPPFDQALAALLEDIHLRGLSEKVLVVAMGEFGRSPRVDAQAGRGHWAKAMSVLFGGGGMPHGRVVGKTTSDAGEPATQAYGPGDILATIYQFLGIDPSQFLPDQQNRPVRLVDTGTPIRELYS